YRLKEALAPVVASYDYVLVDCPPSLGLLTVNALSAADSVLVPMQCEFFALEGLSELTATLARVKRALKPALEIEGVLLTMVDERTNLTQQVIAEGRGHFKEKVFDTQVPRSVRLAEAPSFGQPVILYDIRSRGAEAYLQLAKELMADDQLPLFARSAPASARRPGAGCGRSSPTRRARSAAVRPRRPRSPSRSSSRT